MEATLKALPRTLQLRGSQKYHQQCERKQSISYLSGRKLCDPQTTDLRVKGAVGSGSQASFSVSSCVCGLVEALNLSECQFPHL